MRGRAVLTPIHAPIRLDGPEGPDGPPPDVPITTGELEESIRWAALQVRLHSAPVDGVAYVLRWGEQVDCRTITDNTDPDRHNNAAAHPRQVAGYLAKYLTKATEDFGLPSRVLSAKHAVLEGASPHAIRLIETAEHVHAVGGGHVAIGDWWSYPRAKARAPWSVDGSPMSMAPHNVMPASTCSLPRAREPIRTVQGLDAGA